MIKEYCFKKEGVSDSESNKIIFDIIKSIADAGFEPYSGKESHIKGEVKQIYYDTKKGRSLYDMDSYCMVTVAENTQNPRARKKIFADIRKGIGTEPRRYKFERFPTAFELEGFFTNVRGLEPSLEIMRHDHHFLFQSYEKNDITNDPKGFLDLVASAVTVKTATYPIQFMIYTLKDRSNAMYKVGENEEDRARAVKLALNNFKVMMKSKGARETHPNHYMEMMMHSSTRSDYEKLPF